ncbi:hypothetical protein [Nonomuraea diastatica]|uniref:Uncharacterized protein n=1 Tax=Nonomuraea diastatica TaxID=1848329 RepID=A0A4V2YG32_9ACTN|nr:hypothetical protein [Nonomuraea diastatica]TDD25487.1 hypothetical protein E1294_02550 [Nonomuraea diastatica]
MRPRSFARASGWLAVLIIGVPVLGLVPLAVLRFLPAFLRALVAAVAVFALAWITPFHVMASYPVHVVRCGGLPVVATGFAASMTYNTPGSAHYWVTPLESSFFCTEREARAAGYSGP